jgi:hypothetical protein
MYSAPPRRAGGTAAASAASAAPVSFSSFGRPARSEDNGSGRNGFDSAASAAFGKKPARTFEADSTPHKTVVVTPARNTLASMLDDLLPSLPESKQREWSTSALQKQRKAEKAKPPPPKSFDEEFPTLGGAGGPSAGAGAARIPKPVFGSESKTEPSTSGSFASLAANWAKTDAERKIAEETATRMRQEQEHRDELERAARVHFRTNLNSTRNQYYHEYDGGEGGDEYDDEYVEGELDEEYSKKDILADKRAAAVSNHYSDEEEDEDTADYNIGPRTGGGW